MKKDRARGLDFEVDLLSNSIVNVVTGDSFQTDISIITEQDLKTIFRNNNWVFNWTEENKHPERDIYKLTIVNNQE